MTDYVGAHVEPGAALWEPSDFQLANWTFEEEEPAAAVWAPAAFPVVEYDEYAPNNIFSFFSAQQTSITGSYEHEYDSSTGAQQQQLVQYYAHAAQSSSTHNYDHDPVEKATAAAAAQDHQFVVDLQNGMGLEIHADPIHVFENAAREFKAERGMATSKIHRYPPSIRALGERYTAPTMVAIGPYHHYGAAHLQPAEKVKHVAAYHCIRESGRPVQEVYDAVAAAAADCDARGLYDRDAVEGLGDGDFLPMMFYDACFLVQYMLTCTGAEMEDPALRGFFDANDDGVYRDIMLLENQLPWRVVQAVMRFRPVPLEEFVAAVRGCLQDRKVPDEAPLVLDEGYEPPHLLGLLRHYVVGRSADADLPPVRETGAISFSVSAIKLAEIGIALTANDRSTELVHMGVRHKPGNLISAELSLAPLSLDDTRASLLLSMAALELCTTPSFQDAEDEASAVCSYLGLLAMIVDREEDVHELRARRLLQGGGGHTNRQALEFLTSLQGLRLGSRYVRTMEEIERYKVKRRTRTKVHAFVYRNIKTIVTVISAIAALVGILGTLKSLNKAR